MKTEIYWKVAEMLAASVRDGAAYEEVLKEVRLSLFMELDKDKVHGWPTADTERLLRLTDDLPTCNHLRGVPKMENATMEGGQL